MQKAITDYDKFYQSSDWRHPSLPNAISRVQLYLKIAALDYPAVNKPTSLSVLDVGCGTGFYTHVLSLLGYKADGCDYSIVAINKARTMWGQEQEFFQADANNLSQIKGKYNLIFAKGLSLYNTDDMKRFAEITNHFLSELKKPGAVLIIVNSDLSGKEASWVNYTYSQLTSISTFIDGKFAGPWLFDYWVTPFIFRVFPPSVSRQWLKLLRLWLPRTVISYSLRLLKIRVPIMYVATTEGESSD
jgi:SAM-dependent methyltransferase